MPAPTEPAQADIVRTVETASQVDRRCKWARLPKVTGTHVRLALERLRSMSLVGLTGEFERSMRMWAARRGTSKKLTFLAPSLSNAYKF